MGSLALVDATTWIGALDATGFLNSMSASMSVAELDSTVFGQGGYRSRKGGLKTVAAEYGGFFEAGTGTPDPEIFTNLGVADRVITLAPTATETSVAYMYQGGAFAYSPFGSVGELTPFTLSHMSTNAAGIIRGQVTKAKANVSSTGTTGTAVQLGNVGAAQFLYATLHVFGSGTSLTLVVESDDSGAFSSPTTRITFGPITTAGGTWGTRVAGALAETHYRINVTAVTGTFSIAAAIGIGS